MDTYLKREGHPPSWGSRFFGWHSESCLVLGRPGGNNSGLVGGAEDASGAMMKGGRRKRTAAGTVAVLSAVCAALLWAGVSSFSHAQLPTGTGSNSTRRTSEVKPE